MRFRELGSSFGIAVCFAAIGYIKYSDGEFASAK